MELALRPLPSTPRAGGLDNHHRNAASPAAPALPSAWDGGKYAVRVTMMRVCAALLLVGVVLALYGLYMASFVSSQSSGDGGAAYQPFVWASALVACGAVAVLVAGAGFVAARNESVRLLVFFFYAALLLIAAMLLIAIAALAFKGASQLYVDHHWDDPGLRGVREQACCGTKAGMHGFIDRSFNALGGAALGAAALLAWSCRCCVALASVPIIMHSMLPTLNGIHLLLGAAIVATARAIGAHRELGAGNGWIAELYLAMGVTLMLCPWLGIYGARRKSRGALSANIAANVLVSGALLACAVGGFAFANVLSARYESDQLAAGSIACQAGLAGCSNCTTAALPYQPCPTAGSAAAGGPGAPHTVFAACAYDGLRWSCPPGFDPAAEAATPCGQCPQWTGADIHIYVQSNLRFLATAALLCLVFLVTGTVAARLLRASYEGYQCQSI
jgi:hypothetical protein